MPVGWGQKCKEMKERSEGDLGSVRGCKNGMRGTLEVLGDVRMV